LLSYVVSFAEELDVGYFVSFVIFDAVAMIGEASNPFLSSIPGLFTPGFEFIKLESERDRPFLGTVFEGMICILDGVVCPPFPVPAL